MRATRTVGGGDGDAAVSAARVGDAADTAARIPIERPRRWDRNVRLLALLVFALALSIRLVALGSDSFWIDEGATAANASAPIDVILEGQEVKHPPGYYVLMHYVAAVNDSEAALRLPSALASSVTALMIFAIGFELLGRRAALIAGLLAVFSPLGVWFAQEARQPAVATAIIAVAAFGLVRGGWPGRVVAGVALFLALLVDWVAAAGWLAFGGVWVYLSWSDRRPEARDWAAITAAAFLAMIPLQGARFWNGFGVLQQDAGPGIWYGDVLGSNPLTSNPVGVLAVIFVLAVGAAWVVDRLLRTSARRVLAAIAVAGYGLTLLVIPVPRAFSLKKILVVGWPIVIVFVAFLVASVLAARWRRFAAVAVIGVSVLAVVVTMLVPKDDWRAAVTYVNEHATAGDVAWVQPDPWSPGVYDYYDGALPLEIASDPASVLSVRSIDGDVWLITKRRPQDSIPALEAERWFDEQWQLIEEINLYRLAVRRYAVP